MTNGVPKSHESKQLTPKVRANLRGFLNRQLIIFLLTQISVPCSPTLLSRVAALLIQKRISPTQIKAMLAADRRSYLVNKQHHPYIVPTLSVHVLAPLTELTLSNWPLHRRICGPANERVDVLRAMCRTLDLDAIYPGTGWRAMVQRLLWEFPLDPKQDLRARIAALFEPMEADDLFLRKTVADSAEQCDLVVQLFGKLNVASMEGEQV